MAVSTLLNIGNSSLLAHQVALNVTGNNVANADTPGYCRQSVRFEEATPLNNIRPGQQGQGVVAAEIYRNFNRFVENSFLDRFTQQSRWGAQADVLGPVENLFNEANRDGISSQLSAFFNSWNTLATTPESLSSRQALLSQADNLAALLRNSGGNLADIQKSMDDYIRQTVGSPDGAGSPSSAGNAGTTPAVGSINKLLDDILNLNKQIAATDVPGVVNANALYDQRDQLVRKLAEQVDIRVVDNGRADLQIYLKSGQPLLFQQTTYKLRLQDPLYEKHTEHFYGDLKFSGSDSKEYTLEFTDANTFKVSLDGGRSWMSDANGQTSTFAVPPAGQSVHINNLDVSFESKPGDQFTQGDKFLIVPKMAIYWDSPTRDPINVTPQTFDDGTENPNRITGGSLGAYFDVRDNGVGKYLDQLNAMSKALIWEVNYLHSQGTGLQNLTELNGTYTVGQPNVPLGGPSSQTPFADRLKPGNLSVFFYDATTGQNIAPPAPRTNWNLDFDNPAHTDDTEINFDPKTHTLQDVVDAINRSFPSTTIPGQNMLVASIEGGKVNIKAADGVTFRMGQDTSGIMAALGLNTFYQGSDATDISINPVLRNNLNLINAQSVDGQRNGEVGDGMTASLIAQLARKGVTIFSSSGTATQSLNDYYAGLVGQVGSDVKNAEFNRNFNTALAADLDAKCTAITGVNLDEEMTNLIRFQHAYTAAAKLITTADQMMETILGLKQ